MVVGVAVDRGNTPGTVDESSSPPPSTSTTFVAK